jgi:hypothetical protein
MNDDWPREIERQDDSTEPPKGPNLTLLYGLIALALAVAIGLAALIVRPFYLSR